MRIRNVELVAVSAAVITCAPLTASGQLKEIIVTAASRDQDTGNTGEASA
jgi:hypothetical protein